MIWLFLPIFLFSGVIENNISQIYKNRFNTIKIKNITIKNYKNQKIYTIDTSNINPKRINGTIKINKHSFIFYTIDATIKVLKSIQILKKNDKLTPENTKLEVINFKNFYSYPITNYTNKSAKMYIPQNKIIYQYMIQTPYLVHINENIKIISKSGDIELILDGIAMQNGRKNDFIKVRIGKKIYKVKIIDKGLAKL